MRKPSAPRGVPKWQVVEHVVAAVERAIGLAGSWKITQNAMVRQRGSRRRRQVDVFAECPSGPRAFRVAIDVKNETAPLDIEMIEQLCAKARKLEVDRYVVVSTSGFTEQSCEEAERSGVVLARLEEVKWSSIFAVESIRVPLANLTQVALGYYEDDGPRPPHHDLKTAWIESNESAILLEELALQYVRQWLTSESAPVEGETNTLRIVDEPTTWTKVRCGGVDWPAPREIHVRFTLQYDHVPGRRFKTEDGHEAFTATIQSGEVAQQATLVSIPAEGGGFRLAVSLAPAHPKRTAV